MQLCIGYNALMESKRAVESGDDPIQAPPMTHAGSAS